MAAAQQEQDKDANDDDTLQKDEQAKDQQADGADADATKDESGAEGESKKEQVSPSLTVTNPGSGAQFPGGQPIPVEFDCEGDVEFTAHVSVVDAAGTQVLADERRLKLDEGKGHGAFSLVGDALVGGKYDVMVWGDSNGQATAVQKLQVEIVDTEAEEEPAPAVAVEGDDGDGGDAAA